ncbi:MAG: ATP-binding protein, partial [Chloroflexi bacterium]|nr:ATP-binding protein [Chloroflexota bacterium]
MTRRSDAAHRLEAAEDEVAGQADASLIHLFGRLGVVEARVRAAVDRRRADDPDPNDRFRGLYISDAQVDGMLGGEPGPLVPGDTERAAAETLAAVERRADDDESAGSDLRLRRLARAFGLTPSDVELLLIALAPDLDPRFERLYGYLNDDVSRRRASTGLALELAATGSAARSGLSPGRARLGPHRPLVAAGLVLVEEGERPFLTRPLRVPDRVTAHLLGGDAPDPLVKELLTDSIPAGLGEAQVLARAIASGIPLAYVRERPGSSGRSLARAAFEAAGRPAV